MLFMTCKPVLNGQHGRLSKFGMIYAIGICFLFQVGMCLFTIHYDLGQRFFTHNPTTFVKTILAYL